MVRLARVIAVGVPHHITQRGNARRFILQDQADRKVYLDLLRQSTENAGPRRRPIRARTSRHFPLDELGSFGTGSFGTN